MKNPATSVNNHLNPNAAHILSHLSRNNTSLKNPLFMEAKDLAELSSPPTSISNAQASLLGPITPDSNKETSNAADTMSTFASPLTNFPSPPRCLDTHPHCTDDLSSPTINTPSTPKEGVFDPFAPGPDKLMLAPQCTKYLDESRSHVVRMLDFTSSCNIQEEASHATDEDMLLETVYDTLLKAIVSKQTEELLSKISSADPPTPDGFKTPTSAPCLNGISETCPGAPLKPARKLRNIDLGSRKRLEF